MRELLQPAAKERQIAQLKQNRETTVSADLREPIATPTEHRKSTADAAKATGASTRAVEQAARVEKMAPDLLPQVQAGTMALDKAHKEAQQRERQQAASRPQPEMPKVDEKQTITLLDHKGNAYEYPKPKGESTACGDRRSPPWVPN